MTDTNASQTPKMSASADKSAPQPSGPASHGTAADPSWQNQAQDQLHKAQEHLGDVATRATDQMQQLTDDTAAFVRRNPGVCLAGALGFGLLVGLLVSNNRS